MALRDPGLQLKNSLTGKKKKLAVEDHEVDHPGLTLTLTLTLTPTLTFA